MKDNLFKRRIFSPVPLIVVTALFLGLINLHGMVLVRTISSLFTSLLVTVFHLSVLQSYMIFSALFMSKLSLWLESVAYAVFLWLTFSKVLARTTKYFNEVSAGIDQLGKESEQEITLSPEMDFLAAKLNKIKSILEKRKTDALEAEQRKNDLVVYLAHDIKTPLTSVIGYITLLDEIPDLPEKQRSKYIGVALEKAYRLEQLINEFFEVTRFNLQSIVLIKEKINLSFMLQQMADEFYPMLVPNGKQIVVNAPDGLTLWGDSDKLARVFNNILKNASEYSYKNSTIDISAFQQGSNIVVTFTNQGKPIPLPKLDMIFEKFYRLDSSRSSNTGGAGLGLSIAKKIVDAHGGRITAESCKEYTVFTVILPNLE